MSQSISKIDYERLAAFRYALRTFFHFSEKAAKKAGLTPQQHQAMLAIIGFPGRERISIGELAERLQIQHHSAVGLVDRLASQGLLERYPGSTDRRQVFVSLTPQGEEILANLVLVHQEELRRIKPYLIELLEEIY